jgi:hypothetical protein
MSIGHKSGLEPTRPRDELVRTAAHVGRLSAPRTKPRELTAIEQMARNLAPLIGRVHDTTPDPARAAQLEILRNAVASGRYRPDLREVAWKLLCEVAAARRH